MSTRSSFQYGALPAPRELSHRITRWRESIRGSLHADEARQDAGGVQNGETRGDPAAEPEDTRAVPGERRLGDARRQSPAVSGQRGPLAALLSVLDDEPAVQSEGQLLYSLRRELCLLLHILW